LHGSDNRSFYALSSVDIENCPTERKRLAATLSQRPDRHLAATAKEAQEFPFRQDRLLRTSVVDALEQLDGSSIVGPALEPKGALTHSR
jgi:hypothetical protein